MAAEFVIADKNAFLDGFDSFAAGKLKHPLLVFAVTGALLERDKLVLLGDICFSAKYVTGLYRVLDTANGNPEITNLEAIRKDFSAAAEKSVALLIEALPLLPPDSAAVLSAEFLQLSGASFANLLAILADFALLKSYLNVVKRSV